MDLCLPAEKLKDHGIKVKTDATGAECTTFRTGGPLSLLAEPETVEQAAYALSLFEEDGVDYFVIGNGSNLLIPDEGSGKAFLRLSGELKDFSIDKGVLKCGAGASLAAAAKYTVTEGFMGLEWASGIPGTVGGAIAMNASAYGGETKQTLRRVTAFCGGEVRVIDVDPDKMSYRKSEYSFPKMTVLEAEFELAPDDGGARERMEQYNAKRKSSQPLNYPSAGSTFKRPQGYYAGALIEQAGLKGARVGGASVSGKHAGFIINDNGATSKDVMELMRVVQDKVSERFGVTLEPEVIILK